MGLRIFFIIFLFPSILICKTIDISSNWQVKCSDKQWSDISLPYKISNILNSNKCIFRKKVVLEDNINHDIAFILGKAKTSCKVYFNNILVAKTGEFGKKLIEGSKKVIFFSVTPKNIKKENEIKVEVLSSDVILGLYQGPFLMGSFKEMFIKANNLENQTKYFEMFSIGILFIISSFCLFTYINGIKEDEYFSFGIFVFAYMLYFLLTSLSLYKLELFIPFLQKIGISVFLVLPALLIRFFSKTLKFELSKIITHLNYALFIIALIFFISGNSLKLITVLKLIWLLIVLIYIARIFYLCFRELYFYELPEFKPVIIGLIILCLSSLNDLFEFTNVELFNLGLIVFILFVTYALTVRFSRINSELRDFSRKLIQVRDEERKKLGRELHDGLGQILVALKLNLQMFLDNKHDFYKRIINEVVFAISELKNICEQLRPAILESMGFIPAVNYLLKKFSKNFKYNLNIDENIKLTSEQEEHLFRIFQECLNNALKYSNASEIAIEFAEDNEKILFKFQDNGKGFDLKRISKKGLGLLSIKERCLMLKAELQINSYEGKGTSIIVIIKKSYGK